MMADFAKAFLSQEQRTGGPAFHLIGFRVPLGHPVGVSPKIQHHVCDQIGDSLALYWHRTTAKVIGEGYAGRTDTVTTCPTLNALDYSLVQPGDPAVTAGGDHVMAYLGNQTWIATDPGVGKVSTFTIPDQKNAYFSTPMRVVRWKILND